jgi:hypothetical protein
MPPLDTLPEVRALQLERRRRLTAEQRWEQIVNRSSQAIVRKRDAIARHHPEYSEAQVTWAVRRWRLGEDLFREVWPDAPEIAP